MPRTFIAVPVDEALRAALGDEIARLRARAPRVGWTRPGQIHATLKFLGDVPPPDLDALLAAVGDAVRPFTPFAAEIEGLGAFPHPRAPRTVWAGVGEGADELQTLARAVDAACAGLGYPPEPRPYTPHLTLGRAKLPVDARPLADVFDAPPVRFGALDVDAVTVYLSDLRRSGAVHAPMAALPLGPGLRRR